MNMFRSFVTVYLEYKNEELKKHVYFFDTLQCRFVLMMAINIYVPFVLQVMVNSKTPHLSKLAIKNLGLLLAN